MLKIGMPLQNRVDPFGELFAAAARGTLMGNRGGRIHTDEQKLTRRRWASKQWIACALEFNGRQRDVWGRYYTELFFLDEVTALSAGHRPCFECRRKDAEAFAACWARAFKLQARPRAQAMDETLQHERLDGRSKRRHRAKLDSLPDGAMIAIDGEAYAVRGNALLRWTPKGYVAGERRMRGVTANLLTPPSIVAVLKAGYRPGWHASAAKL
ncbi:MAG TPA: hypothetical protein VNR41_05820 [Xanthobacteraceae bacterium]|nr:hypothetical protein [Xanthobacteraceae bacterium]